MPAATIIIPIAPHHVTSAARALQSAYGQTAACAVVPVLDEERCGPGWARNQGLQRATTPYVVFLDADDWLDPSFVARCIEKARSSPGRYIYTDWLDDAGARFNAPDCALWGTDSWHIVTTLLPTAWAREVGGFDETLPGGEDAEFFAHLLTSGYCGTRLAEPLVTYSRHGQRSAAYLKSPQYAAVTNTINGRYGGKSIMCCGDAPTPLTPQGSDEQGLILVRPTWGGRRQERGSVTGTLYPRTDRNETLLVDARDVAAAPRKWQVIATGAPPVVEDDDDLGTWAAAAMSTRAVVPAAAYTIPPPAETVVSAPVFERVTRVARKTRGISKEAVFVLPDKQYPSYTDFRRLIRLSGFDTCTVSEARWHDPAETYILVTPEPLPEINPLAKTIAWVMEYTGEYEPDMTNWQGEIWASDPAWAAMNDARFVLLGSHPGLNPNPSDTPPLQFDVSMLGYMTPRREATRQHLKELAWAPDYPGSDQARHDQLVRLRLMLHVHQHDRARYLAPLRLALAASYRLPVVAESVYEADAYGDTVRFAAYDALPGVVRDELRGIAYADPTRLERGASLHSLLCLERPFERCVREALKQ